MDKHKEAIDSFLAVFLVRFVCELEKMAAEILAKTVIFERTDKILKDQK